MGFDFLLFLVFLLVQKFERLGKKVSLKIILD